MRIRRLGFYLLLAVLLVMMVGIPTKSQVSNQKKKQDQNIIVGRNVNMVSGQTLPGGDPWLQRQNEPSIAVSTRNSLHLLAGANDYRTVEMPLSEGALPGPPEGTAQPQGDAWLGVFKSFDGGESWVSTLLPGYPQDISPEGAASPLKAPLQYKTAADPVVRAGTNGLFYYSGIAFMRDTKDSAVFVARFIDNNNTEQEDPIEYLDTTIIELGDIAGFIDKPWIAVDIPRPGTSSVKIETLGTVTQTIPCGNVYIVYSVFSGSGVDLTSEIRFARSTDCGETWSESIRLDVDSDDDEDDMYVRGKDDDEEGGVNQGATIGIDPVDGTVYVAWRQFGEKKKDDDDDDDLGTSGTYDDDDDDDDDGSDDAIYVAKSTNDGSSFSKPVRVAKFKPFDQGTSEITFRTNSYPTIVVDDTGRVYLAWSKRIGKKKSRIVLSTSKDGKKWKGAKAIDNKGKGHQFMPTLTYAAGKLLIAWYDQRDDASGLYTEYISETGQIRRTIDVRIAQADPGKNPKFEESIQVSRYLFALVDLGGDNYAVEQVQYNPPNYQLFNGGTWPFHSDYVDIAPSPMFLPNPDGSWRFNTEPSDTPIYYVAWTDNRDVRPPWNNDWTNYNPPISSQPGFPVPVACTYADRTGMRNQNIYTARITKGIAVGSPRNTKPLGDSLGYYPGTSDPIPRTFVIYVKNATDEIKSFRLMIATPPEGVNASFLEFESLSELDVSIAPYSTISRPVFVASLTLDASVTIDVAEIDYPGGVIVPGGYTSSIVINPDDTNPGIPIGDDLSYKEYHNPNIINPNIINPNIINPNIINWDPSVVNPNIINPNIINPNIINPNIINPNIINPNIINPNIINPNIINPNIINPNIINPNIINPNIINPNIINPNIINPNIINASITDVVWKVQMKDPDDNTSTGNTASSYTLRTMSTSSLPKGIEAQLLVYRVHYTPGAGPTGYDPSGCALKIEPHFELVANIFNPNIINPNIINPNIINPNIINSSLENATFYLGPNDEAIIDLRIIDPDPNTLKILKNGKVFIQQEYADSVDFGITDQSVESEDVAAGEDTPNAVTTSLMIISGTFLPDGIINTYYSTTLGASGGDGYYSWWINPVDLPPGLNLNNATGVIDGTPLEDPGITYPHIYSFIVEVNDTSGNSDTEQLFIIIYPATGPTTLNIETTSLPDATKDTYYGVTLSATGGEWPRSWSLVSGFLPPNLTLDSGGTISGTPTVEGAYNFTVRVTDSTSPTPQTADQPLSITVNAYEDPSVYPDITISGAVYINGIPSTPLEGVLIHGLPGEPIPTTDADGTYSATVPYDWTGTVIPYKAGYNFDPESIPYYSVTEDQYIQNYNATSIGAASYLKVTGSSTVAAGDSEELTITAYDASHNVATSYTGSKSLTFSGPGAAPDGTLPTVEGVDIGTSTTVNFTNGVSASGAATLIAYKAEITSVDVTDGAIDSFADSSYDFDLTVTPASANGADTSISAVSPDPVTAGNVVTITVAAYDQYQNALASGEDAVVINVTGANTDTAVATDNSNGTYTASYTPAVTGTDNISGTINGMAIGRDADGTSDGTYHLSVTGAAASQLVFTQQPGGGTADTAWAQQPIVEVQDAGGSTITSDNSTQVTLAIDNNPGGGVLAGNTTVTVNAGVATFSGLEIYNPGSGYTLTAASPNNPSLTSDTSIAFNIADPPAISAEEWIKRYNNGLSDEPKDIFVDSYGNVYVTGSSDGSGTSLDYCTVKYDSAGNVDWVVRYNNNDANGADAVYAVAVDASGNVYVTGWSDSDPTAGISYDYATIKYDSSGNQLWVRRYDGPVNGNDHAYGIAVDSSANVYVTGWISTATDNEYATVKYDTDGNELWVARYDGPGAGSDYASSIALDGSGNVYVTGFSYESPNFDYATVKYNTNGSELWVRRYNGPGNGRDEPRGIAVDSTGNVYVTGWSYGGTGTGKDYATVKYDTNGAELWASRYDGPLNNADEPRGIAVDSTGNVYVTGWSYGESVTTDYATVKYDTNGAELWVRRYDGPGSYDDSAWAIAVDSSGNVYATGKSTGNTPPLGEDYATVKYDSGGNEKWVRRYNGPANSIDMAWAIAVDSSGNVYVTGRSAGTGYDYATIKYRPSLEEWAVRYDGPASGVDTAGAIVTDSSGNVYVAGSSNGIGTGPDYAVAKYDADGTQLWAARYDGDGNSSDYVNAIAIDSLGVYVTGTSMGSGAFYDYATVKFNINTGAEEWVARYDGSAHTTDSANAIAVDSSGVYVTGTSNETTTFDDYATVKYDKDTGVQLWVATYDNGSNDGALAVAVDSSGVYVTGMSYGGEVMNLDYATVKYDNSSGAQQWAVRYDGLANNEDYGQDIGVDAPGNVYVTGRSVGTGTAFDYATIKYSAGGAELWVSRYDGSGHIGDVAKAMAVDSSGNVYVTGISNLGPNQDFVTIKYDTNGAELWAVNYDGPNNYDDPNDLAIDSSGNVYVTGESAGIGTNTDYATVKYNANGILEWVFRYNGDGNGFDIPSAITVDWAGNFVYVAGKSDGSGTNADFVTIKYKKGDVN